MFSYKMQIIIGNYFYLTSWHFTFFNALMHIDFPAGNKKRIRTRIQILNLNLKKKKIKLF